MTPSPAPAQPPPSSAPPSAQQGDDLAISPLGPTTPHFPQTPAEPTPGLTLSEARRSGHHHSGAHSDAHLKFVSMCRTVTKQHAKDAAPDVRGVAMTVGDVVQGLMAHKSSSAAARTACKAITRLATLVHKHGRVDEHADAHREMEVALPAVVGSLKEHNQDPAVQEAGLHALASLCKRQTSGKLAGTSGAVEAAVEAMLSHHKSHQVQEARGEPITFKAHSESIQHAFRIGFLRFGSPPVIYDFRIHRQS